MFCITGPFNQTERSLDLQHDALKRARCEKIIEDTASGGKVQRPGLERVHDMLAVWRLDRLTAVLEPWESRRSAAG